MSDTTAISEGGMQSEQKSDRERMTIRGIVEHGNAWGRELGFRTANMPLSETMNVSDGVWAGYVRLDGDTHQYVAAISVGTRPTYYSEGVRLLEAHLLD